MNPINKLLATACFAGLVLSCQHDHSNSIEADGEPAACCSEEAPAALTADPLPDTSLYLLDSEWLDQTGAPRNLSDFKGKLVVAAMIFTNCEYACPRILQDLKAVEAGVPADRKNDVQFLLVSMDSLRDTPDVLAAYAESRKLDTKHWTLLHGDDFAVRGIAAGLGIRYKRDVNGNYSHSNLINLLDVNGELVHQLEGLGADTSESIDAIIANLP